MLTDAYKIYLKDHLYVKTRPKMVIFQLQYPNLKIHLTDRIEKCLETKFQKFWVKLYCIIRIFNLDFLILIIIFSYFELLKAYQVILYITQYAFCAFTSLTI